MARELYKRFTDRQIRAIAPINVLLDPHVPLNNVAGASAFFNVYDPSEDEVLTVAIPGSSGLIDISNVGVFEIGDVLELTRDDGTTDVSTSVSSIDVALGQITLVGAMTGPAAVGNRVRTILGTQVVMTEYGTADLNTRTWGYQGLFANNHPSYNDPRAKIAFDIEVEIRFTGGVGLKAFDVICATIQEDDCG